MKSIKLAIVAVIIVLTIVFGQEVLPWWISGLISFICGFFIINKRYTAFIFPFLVSGLTWIVLAFIKENSAEVSIANMVSEIFKNVGKVPIFLITGLIIALINGFFSLSGNYFKRVVSPQPTSRKIR
jgi:hypothetical protein